MKNQVLLLLLFTFMLVGHFEVKASSAPASPELILPHSNIHSPNIQKNPSFIERIMLKKIEKKIKRSTYKDSKRKPKGKNHTYGILSIIMLVSGLLCIQLGMTFSLPVLLSVAAVFIVPFIIFGIVSLTKKEKPKFVGLFSMLLVGATLLSIRIGTTILPILQILGF